MPDAIFAHPRLAQLYDAFDGPRDDLAAYVAIATELGADRILDVGCGTGCLALLLARTGRALGAAPLSHDEAHSRAVADLTVYLRQHHAERDLALLGERVAEQGAAW